MSTRKVAGIAGISLISQVEPKVLNQRALAVVSASAAAKSRGDSVAWLATLLPAAAVAHASIQIEIMNRTPASSRTPILMAYDGGPMVNTALQASIKNTIQRFLLIACLGSFRSLADDVQAGV